jgi:exodeoxyribonuclease V beta subunit
MKPFDLLRTPLEEGVTLIEASAGTGKTHTIAGLFLRLLVERRARGEPIDVDEILVVTYTEAATEELRDRIRRLLARAVEDFQTGGSDDERVQELLRRHREHRATLAEQLALSLNCFDLAPIYTIHGFCQRVLKDRAFESSSLFDVEVLTDQTAVMQEIADDFWRRTFYQASPVRVAFALKRRLGPARFLPFLQDCINHPRLKLIACAGAKNAETIGAEIDESFAQARRLWREQTAAIRSCIGSKSGGGNKPYNGDAQMADLFAALERLFADGCCNPDALEGVLEGVNMRKDLPPPKHPFFDLCERLVRLEADYATALQKDFFLFAQKELRLRKEKLKLLSYDDLLSRLNEALAGEKGAALAEALGGKYKAALIDEFQDTDVVQSKIFKTIFSRPGHLLFLIGDPKQAIYGFRGADIFTYLDAARHAGRKFTLHENWRSEAGLVGAVNAMFEQAKTPFIFPEIGFESAGSRGKAESEPLTIDGRREPPLQLWFCRRDNRQTEIPKSWADTALPRAVAAEISRLLNGNGLLGDRELRPQDFAVLVMTHRQARMVQDALSALGIPSVQQTQQSVFATDEAIEVLRLLTAIAQPTNEPLVRAALATKLLGETANSLSALQTNEAAWQERLQRFRADFDRWIERGFTAMFRGWLERESVRARLLSQPNGERALTNVLHLGEVLHTACLKERLGAAGLIKWLATHTENKDSTADEHQLRLERDENAVQLVTVHKSKGLQYEIVFVPFCWRGSELKARNQRDDEQQVFFHESKTGELVRDLGPDFKAEHLAQAKHERLAENVRLFYVALTRARHRCYVVWGAFSGSGNSAPAWLFHGARGSSTAGLDWTLAYASCSDAQMREDLKHLAERSGYEGAPPVIEVCDLPLDPGLKCGPAGDADEELVCRRFAGVIEREWRITSFSGLVAGRRDEAPDHDAGETVVEAQPEAVGIFAFPAGPKPGTCLHKILEELDFSSSDAASIHQLASRHLREHGLFKPDHVDVVEAVLRNVLQVSLDPARPQFKLCGVQHSERLNEIEFCYPLRPISPQHLAHIFARHVKPLAATGWPEELGRLTFSPSRGFMKGFIDLVFRQEQRFFLVDWKSNHLGNRIEDYSPARLRREMAVKHYALQYHLYVLALHRYLKLRLPGYRYEEHFGGVRYVFLRGLEPSRPEFGIFDDRPSCSLIEELERALLEPMEVEE